MLDYYLPAAAKSVVEMDVLDAKGTLIRKYLSTDKAEPDEPLNVPSYWIRQPKALATSAGMHRWIWDLRSNPPSTLTHDYPISATFHDTPREPLGVWVMAGTYTVRLTVDGQTSTQKITVVMDPRNSATPAGLQQAHDLATELHDGMDKTMATVGEIRALEADLALTAAKTKDATILAAIHAVEQQASTMEGERVRGVRGAAVAPQAANTFQPLTRVNGTLGGVYNVINNADAAPTTQAIAAAHEATTVLATTMAAFAKLRDTDLPALNKQLQDANLAPLGLRAEVIKSVENPYDEGEEP
jgi:hypothetical protein